MDAIRELAMVRERLENQIRSAQAELGAVNKTIEILESENKSGSENKSSRIETKSKKFSGMGLTEACRAAIKSEYVTPHEVRDVLRRGGFPAPSNEVNLLNAVYATIQRLAKKGEFQSAKMHGRFVVRRPAPKENNEAAPAIALMERAGSR